MDSLRVCFAAPPVGRITIPPLPDAFHVGLAFEVVGASAALAAAAPSLSSLAARRFVAIVLARTIARVRKEWLAAVAAGFLVF